MSVFATDVTDVEFDQAVIQASKQTPVLVDFWAPWCGPCRALTPVLDKLAGEYQGKFLLAKVNSDENSELARRFNIRSIPNVKAFVDGELVDEFLGALPESAVREFIDGLLPSPGEVLRREALAKAEGGDNEQALELLSTAARLEPKNDAAHADRIGLFLDLGRLDEAREAASHLSPLATHDQRISRILARLQFADGSKDQGDTASLQTKVQSNPDDLDARLELAKLYVNQQHYEPALEQLLEIAQRDRKFGDDIGRKAMLAVFDLMGAQHELASRFR
jgi:putative thioredoxin